MAKIWSFFANLIFGQINLDLFKLKLMKMHQPFKSLSGKIMKFDFVVTKSKMYIKNDLL